MNDFIRATDWLCTRIQIQNVNYKGYVCLTCTLQSFQFQTIFISSFESSQTHNQMQGSQRASPDPGSDDNSLMTQGLENPEAGDREQMMDPSVYLADLFPDSPVAQNNGLQHHGSENGFGDEDWTSSILNLSGDDGPPPRYNFRRSFENVPQYNGSVHGNGDHISSPDLRNDRQAEAQLGPYVVDAPQHDGFVNGNGHDNGHGYQNSSPDLRDDRQAEAQLGPYVVDAPQHDGFVNGNGHQNEHVYHNDWPLPLKRPQPLSGFAPDVGGNAHGTADHTFEESKARHFCDMCGKQYANPHNLMKHVAKKHAKEGQPPHNNFDHDVGGDAHGTADHTFEESKDKYFCDICGNGYTTTCNLNRHVKQNHQKDGQPPHRHFKCDQCDTAFYFQCELKSHMICHTDERNFKCEDCGKRFKFEKNLGSHQCPVHNKQDPFTCERCHYVTNTIRGHNNHMLRHNKVTEHPCHTCNLRFVSLSQLQIHQRIHQSDA